MTTSMEMLASIFKDIFQENDSWREPIARSFEDIAHGLREGLPREDVEIVCLGAARAIREPERLETIEREMVASIEARK